ncbi:HlyD family efflux transporter periplasmic adaptor subunit [Aliiroseovarius subalbicans]|uniref:HlyD family secretion protein n=1 Tax=Aliiroseovarius subalbicans TaxID=2925840 RepID=UPI001F578FDD|nr:HlyD family efflux transporter periplasmic adaptor subunit [Aliiroseovarius subalbicans]MCI2400560.1 HlyD family efflux transporter periplasmic adaptor subunit [Aliiroseovarius subalbicans]
MSDFLPWIMSLFAAVFPSLGEPPAPVYAGYVEAEYVHVAPTLTRRITDMAVAEGDLVAAGDLLYALDATREAAALRAAVARQAAAEANLHNLETGSRAAEIQVIDASLQQALADQALARSNLARSQSLFDRDIVTTARVDADSTALERANAQVSQLRAQLEVAQLPARVEQVAAAQASLDAAAADADQARSTLDDLTVTAPASGLVDTTYFEPGEVASAGKPVLSILPPGALTVLFYIPEPERLDFAVGQTLALSCDGCDDGLTVRITRMASDPQYTPPVIYSRDERARLVFRAEARLESSTGLLPGQPVTLARP